VLFLVEQDFGALMADTSEHLVNKLNQSTVIDRLGQLDVAEVTWALVLSYTQRVKNIRYLE
jgi:hypothetical protein